MDDAHIVFIGMRGEKSFEIMITISKKRGIIVNISVVSPLI